MNIFEYYNDRIFSLENELIKINKQSNFYSLLRLIIIIIGFSLAYPAFKTSPVLGLFEIIVFLVLFAVIYILHERIIQSKERNENILKIITNEIELTTNGNIFGNGEAYKDPKHIFTSDLDIFGKYSIFNMINRTVTNEGEIVLANKLKNPDNPDITNTQKIIVELSKLEKFREEFLLSFFIESKSSDNYNKITDWFTVFKYNFLKLKYLRPVLYAISFLTSATLLLGFAFPNFWSYSAILIAISFVIVIKYTPKVNLIHNHVSKQADLFKKYAYIVKTINNESFENQYLVKLQDKLKNNDNIEFQLKKLSGLIDKLDYRLNLIVGAILNIIMFWDIHYSYIIEKWMKLNSSKISEWIDAIAEIDSLISLSILHYNNPDWNFPEISENGVYVDAKAIAHPLIKKESRVANDYTISGTGQFDIVTGSNMAGKSTFLRTLGVNTILALNGCPVCAESLVVSKLNLITYMRISDSLEDNLSTFHAELERIKSILQYVEKNENCFVLLDELLRGTNSQDRHVGTVALIRQLMTNKASGVIATHDLALTDMINDYPGNIRNFNFNVKTKDDELFFDYKLTPGVCNYFNASLLMKKIGIKIDEISGLSEI